KRSIGRGSTRPAGRSTPSRAWTRRRCSGSNRPGGPSAAGPTSTITSAGRAWSRARALPPTRAATARRSPSDRRPLGSARPLHLGRPAEHPGGADDVALVQHQPDLRGRDTFEERHRPCVEPELPEQLEIAAPSVPEPERVAGDDHPRADCPEHVAGEVLRLELLELVVEPDDERILD